MCEILFGIFIYSNSEDVVFSIINLTILLGKWFLNSCKEHEKPVNFSDFVKMLKDKLESIRMCHVLNDDLVTFDSKFRILCQKLR